MKLQMDFISSENFADMSLEKRISFILDKMRNNRIVVIEGTLDPKEEMILIERTMREIGDKFPGIEVCSMRKKTKMPWSLIEKIADFIPKEKIGDFLTYLTGRNFDFRKNNLKRGLTLIGPSKIIKNIKKDKKSFSVLAEV